MDADQIMIQLLADMPAKAILLYFFWRAFNVMEHIVLQYIDARWRCNGHDKSDKPPAE